MKKKYEKTFKNFKKINLALLIGCSLVFSEISYSSALTREQCEELRDETTDVFQASYNLTKIDGDKTLAELKREKAELLAQKTIFDGVGELLERYKQFFDEVLDLDPTDIEGMPLRDLYESHRGIKDGIDAMTRLNILEDMIGDILEVESKTGRDKINLENQLKEEGLFSVIQHRCQSSPTNQTGLCQVLRGDDRDSLGMQVSNPEELKQMINNFASAYYLSSETQAPVSESISELSSAQIRNERSTNLNELYQMLQVERGQYPQPLSVLDRAIELDQAMGREINRRSTSDHSQMLQISQSLDEYRQCLFNQRLDESSASHSDEKDSFGSTRSKEKEGLQSETYCHLQLQDISETLNDQPRLSETLAEFQEQVRDEINSNINRYSEQLNLMRDQRSWPQRILNPDLTDEIDRNLRRPADSPTISPDLSRYISELHESMDRIDNIDSQAQANINQQIRATIERNQSLLEEDDLISGDRGIIDRMLYNFAESVKRSDFKLEILESADENEGQLQRDRVQFINEKLSQICSTTGSKNQASFFTSQDNQNFSLNQSANSTLTKCLDDLSKNPNLFEQMQRNLDDKISIVDDDINQIKIGDDYIGLNHLMGFNTTILKTECKEGQLPNNNFLICTQNEDIAATPPVMTLVDNSNQIIFALEQELLSPQFETIHDEISHICKQQQYRTLFNHTCQIFVTASADTNNDADNDQNISDTQTDQYITDHSEEHQDPEERERRTPAKTDQIATESRDRGRDNKPIRYTPPLDDYWVNLHSNYHFTTDEAGNTIRTPKGNYWVMFAKALGKGIETTAIPAVFQYQQNSARMFANEQMGMNQKWMASYRDHFYGGFVPGYGGFFNPAGRFYPRSQFMQPNFYYGSPNTNLPGSTSEQFYYSTR